MRPIITQGKLYGRVVAITIEIRPTSVAGTLAPWDNLGVIRNHHKSTDPAYSAIQTMLDTEKLKINPLAFIRGRSLLADLASDLL